MENYKQKADAIEKGENTDQLPLHIIPRRSDRLGRVIRWLKARHASEDIGTWKKLADRVAAIIAKTYAECGDRAKLTDDVALMKIRELLLKMDKGIISRNKYRPRLC